MTTQAALETLGLVPSEEAAVVLDVLSGDVWMSTADVAELVAVSGGPGPWRRIQRSVTLARLKWLRRFGYVEWRVVPDTRVDAPVGGTIMQWRRRWA